MNKKASDNDDGVGKMHGEQNSLSSPFSSSSHLVLHFDINETILIGDDAGGDTREGCLNKILAKSAFVRIDQGDDDNDDGGDVTNNSNNEGGHDDDVPTAFEQQSWSFEKVTGNDKDGIVIQNELFSLPLPPAAENNGEIEQQQQQQQQQQRTLEFTKHLKPTHWWDGTPIIISPAHKQQSACLHSPAPPLYTGWEWPPNTCPYYRTFYKHQSKQFVHKHGFIYRSLYEKLHQRLDLSHQLLLSSRKHGNATNKNDHVYHHDDHRDDLHNGTANETVQKHTNTPPSTTTTTTTLPILHHIVPSFFHTLHQLCRSKRKFTIVLRTFGTDLVDIVRAINYFAAGKHPLYPDFYDPRLITAMNDEKEEEEEGGEYDNLFVGRWRKRRTRTRTTTETKKKDCSSSNDGGDDIDGINHKGKEENSVADNDDDDYSSDTKEEDYFDNYTYELHKWSTKGGDDDDDDNNHSDPDYSSSSSIISGDEEAVIKLLESKTICGIQDDYKFWNAHDCNPRAGKPVWVYPPSLLSSSSSSSSSVSSLQGSAIEVGTQTQQPPQQQYHRHHIFFDDNIHNDPTDSIVAVRVARGSDEKKKKNAVKKSKKNKQMNTDNDDINNNDNDSNDDDDDDDDDAERGITFRSLSGEETVKMQGIHIIRVPTIEPILNENWFLEQIALAEERVKGLVCD